MKDNASTKHDQKSVLLYITDVAPKKLITQPLKKGYREEPGAGIKSHTFKNFQFTGDFQGFIFKNCKFIDCTFENVWGFFLYFKKCSFSDCTFKNSRFSHGQFGWTELSFHKCHFRNVEIDEGDLDNSIFDNCSFRGLKLAEDLFNVEFTECDIEESQFMALAYYPPGVPLETAAQEVTFNNCTISDSYFTNVDFRNSSFVECTMYFSVFLDCTLSNETFIIGEKELRPVYATMDFQTILKSELTDPAVLKAFFNIHGPDYKEKIMEISSETNYKKLFISYSFKDRVFATTLNDTLKKNGIKTFLWEKDAPGGQYLEDIMTKNVLEHDTILFIASTHSLRSKACQFELSAGRKKQEETWKNVFFPIHIDSYLFEVKENEIRPLDKADEYWKNIEELKRVNCQDFSKFSAPTTANRKEFDEAVLAKIVKEIQAS